MMRGGEFNRLEDILRRHDEEKRIKSKVDEQSASSPCYLDSPIFNAALHRGRADL